MGLLELQGKQSRDHAPDACIALSLLSSGLLDPVFCNLEAAMCLDLRLSDSTP